MNYTYTNDADCRRCIAEVFASVGEKKKNALKELCRFRCEEADKFWTEKITDDKYLPYVMQCRSDYISDCTAKKLDDYIERVLDGTSAYSDMVNEGYFLLHVCMFKQSEKLLSVYRKIARNYDAIRSKRIEWGRIGSVSPVSQPDFLFARYAAEIDEGSENTFLNFLNDVIIVTCANSELADGRGSEFAARIRELYDDYPNAFTQAGLYAYMLRDTYEAYDRFKYLLDDPLDYPYVFWVLDGITYENGGYTIGSPMVYVGAENEKTHITVRLKDFDKRWLGFLTEKPFSDMECTAVADPFYAGCFMQIFSVRLYEILDLNNAELRQMCREYFRKACVVGGNAVDFAGLNDCSDVLSADMLNDLAMEIAYRIVQGRQRYCYYEFFHYLIKPSKELKLSAINKAAEYLEQNEHSPMLSEQRKSFREQLVQFASDDE